MGSRLVKSDKRTFNPETPPPHGDFPYLDGRPLHDLDRDANYGFVNVILAVLAGLIIASAAVFIFLAIAFAASHKAHARDLDGHWAQLSAEGKAPPKAWWNALASGKGLCCSFVDGAQVNDVDWDTADACEPGSGGAGMQGVSTCGPHYRVRLCRSIAPKCDAGNKEWIVVPDQAIVHDPNRFGAAVVWPYLDSGGATQIRCFLPGAGA